MAQQLATSVMAFCSSNITGFPRLLQLQFALSGVVQQTCRLSTSGLSAVQQACLQQQQRMASTSCSSSSSADDSSIDSMAASSSDGSSSSSSSSSRTRTSQEVHPRRAKSYQARLPKARKYGAQLRDIDPEAFERMRLVVGYYDLPQNSTKPKPPPPSHVTINNIQALRFTKDVDPYYKLALLSYRSKLENIEILKSLDKTQAFLQQLSAPPAFIPANLDALGAAAQGQKQEAKAAE